MDLEHFITLCRQSPQIVLRDHAAFRQDTSPYTVGARLRVSKLLAGYKYADPQGISFVNAHYEAWAKFVTNLAHWEVADLSLQLPRRERLFIAGWHFPEIPSLFPLAKQIKALLLVSQDAPWLAPLKDNGCTLNIRSRDAALQLKHSMESGRIIAGLLDHYQPDTRFQAAQLLGRTVKTPSGVLELCSRYGYQIAFIAPRSNGIEIVAQVEAVGVSAGELAQRYNDWLESEIRRTPEQWLMWQALPPH